MRIDPEFERRRPASEGKAFVYVLPLAGDEVLKLGFSRDPIERMQSLHRRWFEFFDIERASLIETDRVRDARRIELELKHRAAEHRAFAPPDVCALAGGDSEWFRGASGLVSGVVDHIAGSGFKVHRGMADWLRVRLLERRPALFEWSGQLFEEMRLAHTPGELATRSRIAAALRDALDAFVALGIDPAPALPDEIGQWYRTSARA